MSGEKENKKLSSRGRKALNAGAAGALMGAIGGALIGFSLGAACACAVTGGLLMGAGEAAGDWTRKVGEMRADARATDRGL